MQGRGMPRWESSFAGKRAWFRPFTSETCRSWRAHCGRFAAGRRRIRQRNSPCSQFIRLELKRRIVPLDANVDRNQAVASIMQYPKASSGSIPMTPTGQLHLDDASSRIVLPPILRRQPSPPDKDCERSRVRPYSSKRSPDHWAAIKEHVAERSSAITSRTPQIAPREDPRPVPVESARLEKHESAMWRGSVHHARQSHGQLRASSMPDSRAYIKRRLHRAGRLDFRHCPAAIRPPRYCRTKEDAAASDGPGAKFEPQASPKCDQPAYDDANRHSRVRS